MLLKPSLSAARYSVRREGASIPSRRRPAAAGGRQKGWFLYTSLVREGALAEICYHWSKLTPWPSRPAALHRLGVSAERRLRLMRLDLEELDVDLGQYETINYRRTQEIGAAVAFLGCDGLIVPSARWDCENLVLFTENHALSSRLEILSTEEIDWQIWARDAGFLGALRNPG